MFLFHFLTRFSFQVAHNFVVQHQLNDTRLGYQSSCQCSLFVILKSAYQLTFFSQFLLYSIWFPTSAVNQVVPPQSASSFAQKNRHTKLIVPYYTGTVLLGRLQSPNFVTGQSYFQTLMGRAVVDLNEV